MGIKPEMVVSQLEYPISIHLKLVAPVFVYLDWRGNLVECVVRDVDQQEQIVKILRQTFDLELPGSTASQG